MKPFIFEITGYLADSSSRFIFGDGNTNLKVGEMSRGDDGVYTLSQPSIEPDRYTGIEYHGIDFIGINKSTAVAYEDLQEVYKIFDRNIAYESPNYHVYYSHAMGQVSDSGRDSEGRKMLRLSVLFIVRYNELIS